MKKIIIYTILIFGLIGIQSVFGEGAVQVSVSEDLTPLIDGKCTEKENGYWDCPVKKGFSSVQIMLGNIIKYATFLIGLVGVLFIVINGIMYSIGGDDKSAAKDRIIKSVGGLLLLLLSGVVLNAIAPWVYTV